MCPIGYLDNSLETTAVDEESLKRQSCVLPHVVSPGTQSGASDIAGVAKHVWNKDMIIYAELVVLVAWEDF